MEEKYNIIKSELNITQLRGSITGGNMFKLSRDPEWCLAFAVYNYFNPNHPLGMSCRPCYFKVLEYLSK